MEDLRPAALHSLLANSQRIEARLAVVEAIPTDKPKGMSGLSAPVASGWSGHRLGSTLGEATLDVSGTFPGEAIRMLILFVAQHSLFFSASLR
jgi:hypothetical protein